jgi:dTDP-4-amino-4,6-dideoxygalactose transaminase
MKAGAWKYDIVTDGLKCNMTDIQAAIGLVQLERYEGMINKRRGLVSVYNKVLSKYDWAIIPFFKDDKAESCYHLYTLRIKGFSEAQRDKLIEEMAGKGIATNVHFMPLPMLSFYNKLGYRLEDYPNAYNQYANEISLPLYSVLSEEDARCVAEEVIKCVESIALKFR